VPRRKKGPPIVVEAPPAPIDTGPREPWDRQPGESETAFARFRAWLALPPPRPRKAFAEMAGLTDSCVRAQSGQWRWPERARAWDARLTRKLDEATIQTTIDRHVKHIEATRGVLAFGLRSLAAAAKSGDLAEPADAARMVDASIRLERVLLGEAESRQEVQVSPSAGWLPPADVERLTPEERDELRALLDRPEVARAFELDDRSRQRG